MNEVEEWRAVVGYEGLYEVSDRGRVRSLERVAHRIGKYGSRSDFRVAAKFLKISPAGKSGHVCVHLWKDAVGRTFLVHRLVLDAFVGVRSGDCECRHLNGNPKDNRLVNLAWGTRAENMADRTRLGEHNPHLGEARPNTVLTRDTVLRIRRLKAEGWGGSKIARSMGINVNTVFSILRGKAWKWLDERQVTRDDLAMAAGERSGEIHI